MKPPESRHAKQNGTKTRNAITFFLLAASITGCSQLAGRVPGDKEAPQLDTAAFVQKMEEAKQYCLSHKLPSGYCILVDLSIHSGSYRLVVANFATGNIEAAGLVSHGCGSNPWGDDASAENPVTSNEPNSHCSSVGRYLVGQRGASQWGTGVKYLLHGRDSTNSNALSRAIVLHGWDRIGDEPTYPSGTPEGWGCPAVSLKMMNQLDYLLRRSPSPVLLWIYR